MDYAAITYDEEGRVYYRASSLGQCITSLVAQRLDMQTMAPNKFYEDKFEDGHIHEPHILKKLAEQEGMKLFRINPEAEQDRVLLRVTEKIYVVGHIDAIGVHPVHEVSVVDAKALSKSSFESWERKEWDAFPHYAWQQSAYSYALCDMALDDVIRGKPLPIIMAIKNKNSSEVRAWIYPEPPKTRTEIMKKLVTVEAWAAKGEVPPCDKNEFLCPVWYLHQAPEETPVSSLDQKKIEMLAKTVLEAGALAKDYEKMAKDAKAELIEIMGVGKRATSVGSLAIYKQKSPPYFNKKRFVEDHPGIDIDSYYEQGEHTAVRVTPAKGMEKKEGELPWGD